MTQRNLKGQFIKGFKHTNEWKKEMSKRLIGNKFWDNETCKSNLFKKGHEGYNKGVDNRLTKKCTLCGKEFKTYLKRLKYCSSKCYWKDLRVRSLGENNKQWKGGKAKCDNCGKLVSTYKKGGVCRKCFGIIYKGKNHWNWKGGISRDVHSIREPKYKEWRTKVFERDNFKCKINNDDCVKDIQAHHIFGWKSYPELRYKVNNGITLCLCHHPRKRVEVKRLIPEFQRLIGVSKETKLKF